MATPDDDPTAEVTDLLQRLIRNACVNDGTPDSGHESRSAELLESYLRLPGVEVERLEARPGRANLVVRVEGRERGRPSLGLMGHTDVVPANPDRWQRDPFGGELVDGFVWGRGAIDMLGTTAAMAVAVRRVLTSGFRPAGTLVYLAVADEEALGTFGAKWLTEERWDAVRADYVVTELGGARFPVASRTPGPKLPLSVAEKGSQWTTLRIRGTPGHGSMPYRSDSAVAKTAEVVRRIARYRPPARLHPVWRAFVAALDLPPVPRFALSNAWALERALARLPLGAARMLHAATHTTFAPNIFRGGVKANVIPDTAEVEVDIRTLPGQEAAEVRRMLADAVGDLWGEVEIVAEGVNPASASPVDTPLADVLRRVSARLVPGATTVPFILVGATDARFFRRRGAVAYGYGLFGERIPFDEYARMFHGQNERVDQESLRLSTLLWEQTIREFLA